MSIKTHSHFIASSNDVINNVATLDDPATDIFRISGSNSKTIIVTKIQVACLTVSEPSLNFYFVLRSGLGTGGVEFTDFSVVNVDVGRDPASVATVRGWTTSPKPVGTEIATVDLGGTAPAAFATDPRVKVATLHPLFDGIANPHEFTPGVPLTNANEHLVVSINKTTGGRVNLTQNGIVTFITAQWIEIG